MTSPQRGEGSQRRVWFPLSLGEREIVGVRSGAGCHSSSSSSVSPIIRLTADTQCAR